MNRWSDEHIWNAVLGDKRIVVSTHAVLADALAHGFVHISRLALLVFDEGGRFCSPSLVVAYRVSPPLRL
jgi:ERCC4-related helicase